MLVDEQAFVLRYVQPGLAGLMDGSVSTLAPIFATAFATHRAHTAYLIGVAAAVGAGISMAFAEGLRLFKMGVSWGGHESLALPVLASITQTPGLNAQADFGVSPRTIRLSVGHEDTDHRQ